MARLCSSPVVPDSSAANFVRHVLADTPTHEVTVLDALTYAGNRGLARRAARRPVHASSHGDVCDADAGRRARRRRRRRRALRRRVAQRQLAARPVAVRPDQPRRHLHAARGGPQARRAVPPHLHRRGLRRPRARRPGASSPRPRRTTRPARTPRPRPAPTCWCAPGCARSACGRRSRNCSNNYGPYQHVEKFIPRQITNVHRRHPAQAVRRRRERARLDPRRRPQLGRAATIIDDGRDRRDLPDRRRRRERTTRRSSS